MSSSDPLQQTIVAVATPSGHAARGVVRLSGPRSIAALSALVQLPRQDAGPQAESVQLCIPGIDIAVEARVLTWPEGAGFTGQESVELHTLGNPALLDALVQELTRHGVRLAQSGEFTLRAFLAGRLDLTQAEAVLGMIDANDRAEFDVALQQMSGGLARPLDRLRESLLEVLALLEAGLDFVEEDIEFISQQELTARITQIELQVVRLIEQLRVRNDESWLPTVALIGPPNAGKSSLFNALADREAALVAPVAGTTRDYLRVEIQCGSASVYLVDTAGWVEPDSAELKPLELLAQQLSNEQVLRATVRVLCVDSTFSAAEVERWSQWAKTRIEPPVITVLTKGDRTDANGHAASNLRTSSWTGQGLAALRQAIETAVRESWGQVSDVIPATAARCQQELRAIADAIRAALDSLRDGASGELVASDLRVALDHLGIIVGTIYNDDVLDRIFTRFCIGK